MVIDSHIHYISEPDRLKNINSILSSGLFKNINGKTQFKKNFNVNYGILIPSPFRELVPDEENQTILELRSNNNHHLFPICLLDKKPDFWIEKGAVGIKEHFYGMYLASTDYKKSYRQIELAGVPLITHLGRKGHTNKETFYGAIFSRFNDYKTLCPDMKIVLAHAGCDFRNKYWNPAWENLLLRIRETLPDIVVDISGLADVEILKNIVRVFPVERILFGSDFPYTHPKKIIHLLRSFLDGVEQERIFYRNALELFNLPLEETGG